jgi:glycine dehydrogenase
MSRASLADLEPGANFIRRHIGPSEAETAEMLRGMGAKSLEDFIAKVVPEKIRIAKALELPKARAERTALSYLRNMADRNEVFTSMIGMGYYGTVTPKVILRNVLENPGWYTAYTPYQADEPGASKRSELPAEWSSISLAWNWPTPLLDEATAAAKPWPWPAPCQTSQHIFVDRDTHPANHRRHPDRAGLWL